MFYVRISGFEGESFREIKYEGNDNNLFLCDKLLTTKSKKGTFNEGYPDVVAMDLLVELLKKGSLNGSAKKFVDYTLMKDKIDNEHDIIAHIEFIKENDKWLVKYISISITSL